MGEGLKRAFRAARATRVQPLDWHKECLANVTAHVNGLRRDVERDMAHLERSQRELDFYAEQVATAEHMGKAEFDRERFLVKRRSA